MSDDNGDRPVDPRYDAVFQRGFGGEVVEGLTRRPLPPLPPASGPVIAPLRADSVAAPSRFAPPATVAPALTTSAPSRTAPASSSAVGVAPAAVAVGPAAPSFGPTRTVPTSADHALTHPVASVRRPPWKNPFLIALLIVGLGLIGGALTLANNYAMNRGAGIARTDDAYLFVVLTQYGAPATAVLGMATIIGVVFVFAIEWQRRDR